MERPEGLLDGETLVAQIAVRYSASSPSHVDSAPASAGMHRPTVAQRHSYARWVRGAAAAGFPIAGPEMVLGVTQERLLVWKTGLVRVHPKRFVGAVPLTNIHSAGVYRRLFASVLTLLFDKGSMVGLETLRGGRLRTFATSIPTYTDFRAR